MKTRCLSLGLFICLLAGCEGTVAPYEKNGGSSAVPQLKQTLTLDSGQTFKTQGFIEVFEPNYYVLVSAPDGRDLRQSRASATDAAKTAVEAFDCETGTSVKSGRKYSAEANQWLIVIGCSSRSFG